jgi:putative transposase
MIRAFKYRLFVNANQRRELEIALETHRRLYNDALAQRKWFYGEWKVTRNYQDQSAWFTEEKKRNPFFAHINHSSAQATLRRLDKAFANFFRRVKAKQTPGYPRFRNRDRFDSIEFPTHGDGIRLTNNRLRVQHVGTIRVKLHRPTEGKIKTLTLKREANQWFVIVICELPKPQTVGNNLPAVGLDVGLEHFVSTSDGRHYPNPRFLKAELPKLRRQQRSLARKKKGSGSRIRQRKRVARLHRRISNLRREYRYKVSCDLISRYGRIAVESLNIQGMLKNRRLARAIGDVGWNAFITTLRSKAERAGGEVIEVNAWGTSQECSGCGQTVRKSLSIRTHDCPHCGLVLQRDVNAARNILARATSAPGTGASNPNAAIAALLEEAVYFS